jgi:peroxiredoxin
VGDAVPKGILLEEKPGEKVELDKLTAEGKHVVFFVPGPFTPTCTEKYVLGGC